VLPMSMDIEPLDELPARPPSPPRLVMVSRLTPAKFFEEGLHAFARVQDRLPDARLDVIGSGDDEYREQLEQLVGELGLRGVTFHGRVPYERRRELVRAAHVHVFTSHREGWGLVVSEAAADGTPSVGYDAPGVRDSIAEPEALAPIGDVDALADRALELLTDPARYEAARHAAWQRARAMSPEATADAFEAALG
jgi:glycosyltransferase involved in cell wall biosynthesis